MSFVADLERAAEAHARARRGLTEAEDTRDRTIRRAYRGGRMTAREIAKHVGVSAQRVAAIVAADGGGRDRPTLHEAMRRVLADAGGGWMDAAQLAEEVRRRGLYQRRDSGPVPTKQIRARANNYPDLFEGSTDRSNRVRLR